MSMVLAIFLAFVRVGAIAFGGAYAAIPLVEQEVVVREGWMSYAEFADLLALDEVTPGPILINSATFVGMRLAGIPGAVAATLGCIAVPCVVTFLLMLLFRTHKDNPVVKSVLLTLKCMALALIVSTMLTMALTGLGIGTDSRTAGPVFAVPVMCAAFYLIHFRDMAPLPVMLGCGALHVAVCAAMGLV